MLEQAHRASFRRAQANLAPRQYIHHPVVLVGQIVYYHLKLDPQNDRRTRLFEISLHQLDLYHRRILAIHLYYMHDQHYFLLLHHEGLFRYLE